MAESRLPPFLNHLRHLIGTVPAAALTDGELLERFLAGRDETAIEVLVRRYGGLVFGVCRRVLQNAHAAEDAFQATFLVLVRKAPALDRGKPLGSWLYTVAYRLALTARTHELRRQRSETRAARHRPATVATFPRTGERVLALEEELQRLPERYRAPLVLCYVEGKTNAQAAEILGCPPGSMSARLTQAREHLRDRLARRGFVASAAGLAAVLADATAEAAVPLPLLANTARAAHWFATEEAGSAGFVSARAVALARGAVRTMLVNQVKLAGTVLLAAAMLGTGATLLLRAAPQDRPPAPDASQPLPADRQDPEKAPGDRLPTGALARMGSTLLRHGDVVSFAAYTPDGRGLVTAGRDSMVRLWDLATGQELRRFDWGEARPDRKSEPTEDGAAQRRERQYWEDTARSAQAAVSRDGKIVAASRGGVVCLWETASGKRLRQLQTGEKRLLQLAFSTDGKSLLTFGPGQATAVWEVATGTCVRRSPGQPAPTSLAPIGAIVYQNALVSPGLKYLAYWKQEENNITWMHIRELATGKELPRIKTDGSMALAFSADERSLAWEHYTDASIVFWDVSTGKEIRRLKPRGKNDSPTAGDSVLALAFSPDGKWLAVSWMSHTLELWDLTSGKQTLPAGKATGGQFEQESTDWWSLVVRPALAFSPDGKKLVCSLGMPTVRQFEVETGAEIPGPGNGPRRPVSSLALSADGKSLFTYSSGDPARTWDWVTGKETARREVPAGATQAVFAADGRFGFLTGHDFTFCSADGKKTWTVAAAERPLKSLALSPDGTLLATRTLLRPEVHLWDTATGKERTTLGQADDSPDVSGPLTETTGVLPHDLVFSPDGRFLAASGPSRQLCLWDVAAGTLLWQVLPRAGQSIERFAFSGSGRLLASVNADRTVTLYETVSGAPRGRLGETDPRQGRIYLTDGSRSVADEAQLRRAAPVCLAFSPDGRYLATAQHTPEIRLWDVLAGRQVGQLTGTAGGAVQLLFTHDGQHLVSAGTDTTVLTWDLTRLSRARRGSPDPAAILQPQALETLWTDLAAKDATEAFDAMRKLSASPGQAIPFLKERVHPAAPPDSKRLAKLLADLQSKRFEQRRQAESELEGLADLAGPALRKVLDTDPPLDLRKRVERLLEQSLTPSAGQMRALRAIELLELIGSPEARQILQALAGGVPGARLTREARRALGRLSP